MDNYSQKVNAIEQSHELYQQVAILQENISKTSNQSNEQIKPSVLHTR